MDQPLDLVAWRRSRAGELFVQIRLHFPSL
jgi:hypothetical protein